MLNFKNLSKIIISLGLLGYLIYEAEPRKIFQVFANVQAGHGLTYLALAFTFMIISIFFLALRWHSLLHWYGAEIRVARLYGFYLIGMFFNNFLPTSIGGDIYRVYKAVDETNDRTSSFASVIIERIMGIAATLLMAIVALFYLSQEFRNKRLLYMSVFLFIAIILFFFIMIRNRPFKLLLRLFDKFTIFKIGEKFNKLFEAIHVFRHRRRVLLYVFFFSLLSQISIVLMNYSVVRAFSLHINLSFLFMVIPVTFVLTMLPSINGVGVRDLGFVSLLSRVGISNAEALSLSFMNLLLPMIISMWGAVLFMIQKRKSKLGGVDVVETSF